MTAFMSTSCTSVWTKVGKPLFYFAHTPGILDVRSSLYMFHSSDVKLSQQQRQQAFPTFDDKTSQSFYSSLYIYSQIKCSW